MVLISIDTLRADHLPMYGYGTPTAPFLSSMAAGGIVFEHASVPIPNTTPSHGSMLTGQYASGHGSLALSVPLNRGVETIAEALQQRGYHTAGAVAVSHIGRAGNFDQGFADFSDPPTGAAKREGRSVNADLLKFVASYQRTASAKPLFLFAHYFDCHAPYGWWRGELAEPETLPLAERIGRYDESIRHVDGLIAELHRFLGASGLLENTLFIVTSDHGEQIGERGMPGGHADIYTETLHVPLIVFGAGVPAARVSEPVSSLDIAPSIAAATGARLRQKIAGRNLLPRRGNTLDKLLFQMRGLPDSGRELLVVGNPWYTRSVGLLSGSHYFIKNFDYVYRDVRRAAMQEVPAADRARFKQLAPIGEAGGERRYAIPATNYGVFTVTVDVVAEGSGCSGPFSVSMPPGIPYFAAALEPAPVVRLQFSAARLDTLRIAVNASTCSAKLYYRLDRPADAPHVADAGAYTRLFVRLYAERKHQSSDELYDLETDPEMKRNLIAEPSLDGVRKQLERRTQQLYGEIYGAAFDRGKATPLLPREEIEKLKSLGYLF